MMNKIVKRLNRALCRLLGYQAIIIWAGDIYHHYAWQLDDAIAWLAQYPSDDSKGYIVTGATQIVIATRG